MRLAVFGVMAAMCLCLSACASSGGTHMARGDQLNDDIDYEKVASVNQWAHNRGATVVWVNYPKRAKAGGG